MQYDAAGNELNGPAVGTNVLGDARTYSPRNLLRQTDLSTRYCLGPLSGEVCPLWATVVTTYWNGYDGRGVRVSSMRSQSYPPAFPESEYFFYTPELTSLATLSSSTGGETDVIWFGGRPVASQSTVDEAPRFTFTDHLGTPILQTDAAASVVWRAEYEPFGNVAAMRAGIANEQPLRFPGQQVAFSNGAGDEESYNVFRWYRSGWGRYTQADPIGLKGGRNLFVYVDDNPAGMIDPVGLKKVCCTEGPSKLTKDAKKAEKTANDLLKGLAIEGYPVAATYCGGGDSPPGQPMTAYYPPYDKFGPCEKACTDAHEGSHASLCKQFGFKAYAAYQSTQSNWAKEEALAYLVEANCLLGAAKNGFVDTKDYPDAPSGPNKVAGSWFQYSSGGGSPRVATPPQRSCRQSRRLLTHSRLPRHHPRPTHSRPRGFLRRPWCVSIRRAFSRQALHALETLAPRRGSRSSWIAPATLLAS